VIGGAAGATAPLIGWAAGAGDTWHWIPWIQFLIIFMWTPPHFWALALVVKDDYAKANVPMLPVVAGDRRTMIEIVVYTLVLIPLTFAPMLVAQAGWIYVAGSAALGAFYLHRTWIMWRSPTPKNCMALFGTSIVYLLVLFAVMLAGSLMQESSAGAAVLEVPVVLEHENLWN
jgi:protoheme IX farnesyltransferase